MTNKKGKKQTFYIYLRTHGIQNKIKVNFTFEELEQWIQDNQEHLATYQTECDVTDHYDRLVASNNYQTTNLSQWKVSH